MELNVTTSAGKKSQTMQVADKSFAADYNEDLLHQSVTYCLARQHRGTRKQKTRSEVSGGGRKPWRQKGTGNARAGTIRSPIWRSGGVTFAARGDARSQPNLNKKMYVAAMRCAVSELQRQGRLRIVDELVVAQPKTKAMVALLRTLQVENALLITLELEHNLSLAARNIPNVYVLDINSVDLLSLISCDQVVMTVDALKRLEELLQ